MRTPVPRHQGHLTSCGDPPSPEISLPVPRQGVQVLSVTLTPQDDSWQRFA
jgi:hypothetical protein